MTRIPVFLALALSVVCVRPARAHDSRASHRHPASHDTDDEDRDCDRDEASFAWAVVRPDGKSVSGSLDDLNDALKPGKKISPPYLWVRDGDQRYVITDAKMLDKIGKLEIPQRMLAEKQAKLGRKQAELGRMQARLGMEQAKAALHRV